MLKRIRSETDCRDCQCKEDGPGYVVMVALMPRMNRIIKYVCFRFNYQPLKCLISLPFYQHMQQVVSTILFSYLRVCNLFTHH